MPQLARRDFLKAAGMIFIGALVPKSIPSFRSSNKERPNIIIILCDALSAKHMSLHGYLRQTTPNIDAFAERSNVYSNHYSGGNFTTTGTACMLTGMNAWKHRAINYEGLVSSEFIRINPFTLLGPDYFRFAFSQNVWPVRLMDQYYEDINRFLSPSSYSRIKDNSLKGFFKNDPVIASTAIEDLLLSVQAESPAGSSLFGYINKSRSFDIIGDQKVPRYPKGVPEVMHNGYLIPYLNENVYKGVYSELAALESGASPYYAYFHLWSPHYPYRPRGDYRKIFSDGYSPIRKQTHPFSSGLQDDYLLSQRTLYDQQIAQVDYEFGKLVAQLDKLGIMEHSYVFFTSDHGELFERGSVGHGFELMYEPVIRIPLIVHSPGQTKRVDISTLTSNIDVLPTLLSIAGENPSPDIDGRVLPRLGGVADEHRPVFSVFAIKNSAFAPLTKAVVSMCKHTHKIIAYLGYDSLDREFELYDLENDPEELMDIAANHEAILKLMKDELFTSLNNANRPFMKR